MSNVAVWGCGRTKSTRCPNKMLREFGDSTLTDIFLSKLAKLETDVFFAGYEPVFEEKCRDHRVSFVQRTQESAEVDEPASKIYSFLASQPYEYLLHVNGCLPLLRPDTISQFLERCMQGEPKPSFGVVRRNNFYVSLEGKPLNFSADLTTINTKTVTPVHEFAHALYFFRKEDFVKNGFFWDWQEVEYVEMPGGVELTDIDTEDDFKQAEVLWKELGSSVL
jgi:CMP-N-acetylneuraminic acid synthetase